MKITLTFKTALAAALLWTAASAPAQVVYDSNSTAANDGNFATAVPHYLQVVTLALPNGPTTINAFPIFGLRWNTNPGVNQLLTLNFWTGIDSNPGSTNVLAPATLAGTITFNLPAQAVGSYNYSLTGVNVTVPSNTFALEILMLDSTGTNLSTNLGGRLSTGTPVLGSNDGFIFSDTDGILAGSERIQINGNSGNPAPTNYRMQIDATTVAVPEPAGVAFAVGGVLTALLAFRRRRA